MKTAISIPDPVFRSAERLAVHLGVSRSELYCRALKELLARYDQDAVTAELNAVYGSPGTNSGLEGDLAEIQSRSVRGGR